MPTRTARTAWNGTLEAGSGQVELTSSGVATFDVSFPPKRAAEEAGGTTSPEELIAAAHSSCYAMQLSALIAEAGGTPPRASTSPRTCHSAPPTRSDSSSPESSSPFAPRSTASTPTVLPRLPRRPRKHARSARH